MSRSFNQRRGVAEIIRESQAEWRRGYAQGLKGRNGQAFGIDRCSLSFRDGFSRGRDEYLGVAQKPLPRVSRLTPENLALAEKERGAEMARRDPYIPEEVLVKCHPAFRTEYLRQLMLAEEAQYKDSSEYDDF